MVAQSPRTICPLRGLLMPSRFQNDSHGILKNGSRLKTNQPLALPWQTQAPMCSRTSSITYLTSSSAPPMPTARLAVILYHGAQKIRIVVQISREEQLTSHVRKISACLRTPVRHPVNLKPKNTGVCLKTNKRASRDPKAGTIAVRVTRSCPNACKKTATSVSQLRSFLTFTQAPMSFATRSSHYRPVYRRTARERLFRSTMKAIQRASSMFYLPRSTSTKCCTATALSKKRAIQMLRNSSTALTLRWQDRAFLRSPL
mmetsp:Transcript_1033/g.1810  ORF Transcript_1033/g.1810 Transcript_1033/m.1810 type:complete len:258 (+) Transcript_1033:691-1464(+)